MWLDLLNAASANEAQGRTGGATPPLSMERRGQLAEQSVRLGEVSRGRQNLVGAELAPFTEATRQQLQSKRPREQQRPLPEMVRNFQPERALQLDRQTFIDALRSAPRGSAPGPGGTTYDHLKVLLDDEALLNGLGDAAQDIAQACLPKPICDALVLSSMVGLRKPDGVAQSLTLLCSVSQFQAITFPA